MFSKEFESALNQVVTWARTKRHEFITVEHLLQALLDESAARDILQAGDVDIEKLRVELQQYLNSQMPQVTEQNDGGDITQTLGFQRVIQRAVFHVQSTGKREVSGANVLVAIFGEKDSHAVYLLKKHGVNRGDWSTSLLTVISVVPAPAKKASRSLATTPVNPGKSRRTRLKVLPPTSTMKPKPVASTR